MPSIRSHTVIRLGSKHLPLHRKLLVVPKTVGRGLYLHGQRGTSVGSFFKSIASMAKGAFRRVFPHIKTAIKKYAPKAIEVAKNIVKDKALPALTKKVIRKTGVSKEVADKINQLSKFVGDKGTAKLEEETNKLIRSLTGNGLTLHGSGLKKF